MKNFKKILSILKIFLLSRGLARRNKVAFSIFSIIVLLFASIYIYNALHPGGSDAAWWNDNWAYRKSIAITNNASEETNVYINLTGASAIDTSTAGRFQADCGDLRFTKQNGELLKYYIVSGCGTATTVVHVSFQTFPAGAQTIYYYYGNSSAANGFSPSDFSTEASNYTIDSQGSEENSPAPAAYWKFDEGTGTTSTDSTSNKIVTTLADLDSPPSTRSGWMKEDMCISGKCIKLPGGTSGSLTVTSTVAEVKSVSFWVRPASSSAAMINLNASDVSITASAGTISATNFTSPTIYVNGKVSATLTTNQWNFITVTTGTAITASAIKIGNVKGDYLNGFIDDLKLYNFTRSAAQVKADFVSRGLSDGAGAVLGVNDQSSLSNGLVGYWKMDESSGAGSTLADSSGNNNNGTASLWGGGNTATDSAHVVGKYGNGFSFDGGDDYIDIGSPLGTSAKTRTYSIWVKPTAGASSTRDGILGENGGSRIDYGNGAGTSSFHALVLFTGGTTTELTGTGLGTNNWNYLALSIDNEKGIIRFYVNGSLASTQTWDINTKSVSNSTTHYIGRVNSASRFPGYMDEARIYNRALSGAEVAKLYNFAPGPAASYDFEKKNGLTTNDSSGNGLTGTLISGPTWTQGKVGSAISFDGTDDYVSMSGVNTSSGDWTMEAWIFPTAYGAQWRHIFGSEAATYAFGISSGSLQVTNNTIGDCTASTITPSLNTWSHVTATFVDSSDTLTYYVNGVKANSVTCSTATTAGRLTRYIGRSLTYSSSFSGKIDQPRIYNYARSAKQIVSDMNAGHPSVGSPVGSAIGHWKFDEGYGTTSYNSGTCASACNGTLNNMASPPTATSGWQTNGKFGKALGFNKGTTYVDMGNPTALKLTSDMTLSAWVYPSEFTSVDGIMTHSYNTNGNRGYGFGLDSSGRLTFRASSDGTSVSTTNGTASVSLNSWSYVTATYNAAAGSVSYYINGKLDRTVTGLPNSIYSPSRNFQVGAWDSGATGSNLFSGMIDEVKIYNYALTADEVKLDMNQGKSQVLGALSDTSGITGGSVASNSANAQYCIPGDTTSCSAPVGEWKFEEGNGSTVNDSSGNANTGTWNGTAPFWGRGKFGKGGNFGGTNSYVDSGSNASVNSIGTAITVELWARPQVNTPLHYLVSNVSDTGTGKKGYEMVSNYNGTSSFEFSVWGVDGTKHKATASNTLTVGNWHHVVGTYDGSNVRIYVNGALKTTTAYSGSIATPADFSLKFGRLGSSALYYWNGQMDNIRIYDYARTQAQIAWDYNRGAPVGHWKMDECQGSSAFDAAGNGNKGTITIGATGSQTSLGTCSTSSTAWGNGATGKFNSSLNFDGTDDYASVADSPSLDMGTMTISAWIKTSKSTEQYIAERNNVTFYFATGITSGKLCYYIASVAATWTCSSRSVTDGSWHHVVGTWDTSNKKLYIDGVLDTTAAGTGGNIANSNQPINISVRNLSSPTGYFSGQIDDVRLYNYALTKHQVQQVFNQGSAVRFGPSSGRP